MMSIFSSYIAPALTIEHMILIGSYGAFNAPTSRPKSTDLFDREAEGRSNDEKMTLTHTYVPTRKLNVIRHKLSSNSQQSR